MPPEIPDVVPPELRVQCVVLYSITPFRDISTMWNLSRSVWRLRRPTGATWGKPFIDRHATE